MHSLRKSLIFISFCLLLLGTVGFVSAGNLYIYLSFDGVDDYVNCGNSTSLNFGTGNFALEAWVKPMPPVPVYGVSIIYKGDDGWDTAYTIGADVTQIYYFGVWEAGVGASSALSTSLVDKSWQHIVGVKEGTAIKIYVNGELENTKDGITTNPDTSNDLYIGGDLPMFAPHNGSIDEVRIYNRAINSTEISYSFTYKEPQNQTGLVMWLRMNEGSGGSTYDETTNNNDGTLMPNYPSNAPTWIDETPNPITTIPAAEILIAFLPLIGLGYVVAVARSPLKGIEKAYAIIGGLIIIVVLVIFSGILAAL